MSIKICIVDDHQMMREGLRSMLERETDLKIVCEAENGRDAMRLIPDIRPDVVIMDINMPDMNGIEATRQIIQENPRIKVIALSMHKDKYFVTDMLKAGASGYLLKDCSRQELNDAIRAVAESKCYLSPEITGVVIDDYIHHVSAEEVSTASKLTPKEREVLQLIAEGNTSKETASRLGIAVKTVESHRINIMNKLDIHTIADLTKFAIRHGITCLDS